MGIHNIVYVLLLVLISTQTQGQTENETATKSTELENKSSSLSDIDKKRIIRGFTFQVENDVFLGLLNLKNEDKDYTGGGRIEFVTDYLNFGVFPFIKNRKCNSCNYNTVFVQGIALTPNSEVFHITEPVTNQRPYASFTAIGRKRIASFRNFLHSKQTTVVTELVVGKVGGESAKNVQNFIHTVLPNNDQVLGWHNQIAHGGRIGFFYKAKVNYGLDLFANWKIYLTPEITRGNLYKNQGLTIMLSNRHPVDIALMEAISGTRGFLKKRNLQFKTYFNYLYVQHNTFLMGYLINDNSKHVVEVADINRHLLEFGIATYFVFKPNPSKNKNTGTIFFEAVFRGKEFSYHESHGFANVGFNYMLNR